MRKTFLISYFFPPEIGGIQNYLYHLCQGLDADKVVILANSPSEIPQRGNFSSGEIISRGENNKDKESEFDKKQDFKIYRKRFLAPKFAKLWGIFLFFKILKIIKREKIEFLQFGHYHEFCFTGIFYKTLFKLPYSIYFHGIDLFIVKKSKLRFLLFKLAAKNAKTIIANSNFIADCLIKFGVAEEKIKIITPAVDFQKFNLKAKEQSLVDKYSLNDKRVIMSMGRLAKIKGIDLVIKSLPQVIKEIPNLVYLIIGDGPDDYRKELEDLIGGLNLNNHVFFVGGIADLEEEKSRYYNLAELVIMPSREIKYKRYSHIESFGIVALEAQLMGKPVIATNTGGLRESVLDCETGILFPNEDIKALSLAIIKLLKNKDLAYEMGQKGRRRTKELFNWSKQIEKVKELIS